MRDEMEQQWRVLHGYPTSDAASRLSVDPEGELGGYRTVDFLDSPNVVEAAILGSVGTHRLNLWEAFVSALPSRSLGNGDVLFTYVPSPIYPPDSAAVVLWNHERDYFYAAGADDLAEVNHPGPVGDPAKALLFATRCAYLVTLLSRGRFDLDAYLAYNHVPLAVGHPAFFDNVRQSPPSATYALWQMFFTGQEGLSGVLEAAAQSESRWTRDTASLIGELLAGRNELGPIGDMRALQREIAAITANPATLAGAATAQRRVEVERQVAGVRPAVLVRDDAPGEPTAGERSARIGELELEVNEGRHQRFRLVLRRGGRSLSAIGLAGIGGIPDREPVFHLLQAEPVPLLVLWRRSDPASSQHPWDGAVDLYAVVAARLVRVVSWQFNVERMEARDGRLIVRTVDGAGYRFSRLDTLRPEAVPAPPLPGRAAAPPAASPPLEIDGDRLELTPSSLQLWRGKKMLFEEPLNEAYAMTVLPQRRMVAIHGTDTNLRPTVDVLFIRPLKRAVKPGNGCCSWVCFPVDGLDVQLASAADRLYLHDGKDWIEIDEEPLTTVPRWILSRGWVS